MQYDTTLSHAQLTTILDSIRPAWRLDDATRIDGGHHTVYRLAVETPEGPRKVFLKATPPEKPPTVDLEARLLAGIDARSDVPVPTVFGVVDDHDEYPAPSLVTSAVPGTASMRTTLPSVADDELRHLARRSGRYLAELHALDAVDSFGFLTHEGESLAGDRPADDFSTLAVVDPTDSWLECLRTWGEQSLIDLEDTRFADVIPAVEPVVESRIESVTGQFEPVLARIDQSVENMLVKDGEIQALVDWEFTIAATPAYDISCVVWSLAGGPYLFAPTVSDRRPLIREALLAGYSEVHSRGVVEQYRANRSCYELLSTLRSMEHLRGWYELFDLDGQIDDAATQLRSELDGRL